VQVGGVGGTAVFKGWGQPWVTRWGRWQGNPRFSEEFVTHLETELEQSRLRESETLGALKEMQDKVLDMEKVTWDGLRCHAGGPGGGDGPTGGFGDRECPGGSWTWCHLSLGIPCPLCPLSPAPSVP